MRTDLAPVARLFDEMRDDHKRLERSYEELRATALKIGSLYESLSKSVKAARLPQAQNQALDMQYMQLQQKLQNESRNFAMISNVMKTKHDTAKNAISNIR